MAVVPEVTRTANRFRPGSQDELPRPANSQAAEQSLRELMGEQLVWEAPKAPVPEPPESRVRAALSMRAGMRPGGDLSLPDPAGTPEAPRMRPRDPGQDMRAAQRAAAPDPARGMRATQADEDEATLGAADAALQPPPMGGATAGKRADDAENRRRKISESRDYERAYSKWQAEHAKWNTQYQIAFDDNDRQRIEELRAIEPKPPQAPASVTESLALRAGLPSETEAGELQLVDHDNDPSTPPQNQTAYDTFLQLPQEQQEALTAVALRHFEVNPEDVDGDTARTYLQRWLSMQFGEIPLQTEVVVGPDGKARREPNRAEAMSGAAVRLGANNPNMRVGPAPKASERFATNQQIPIGHSGTEGATNSDTRTYEEKRRDWERRARDGTLAPVSPAPRTSAMGDELLLQGQPQPAGKEIPQDGQPEAWTRETFPTQPERITPEWLRTLDGIAPEFGVFRKDYELGEEGDLAYRRAGLRAIAEHQRRSQMGYETVSDLDGTRRYKASPELAAQRRSVRLHRELREFQMANPLLHASEEPLGSMVAIQNPDGSVSQQFVPYTIQLQAAADAGDEKKFRQIQREARNAAGSRRAGNVARQTLMRGETQNFNNPAIAPSMLRESLREAGDDPQAQALVFRSFGMWNEADAVLDREVQTRAVEAQAAAQRAKARADGEENNPARAAMNTANDIAGGLADGTLSPQAAIHATEVATGETDEKKALYSAARLVYGSPEARNSANGMAVVQSALNTLLAEHDAGYSARYPTQDGMLVVSSRTAFINAAVAAIGISEREAGEYWDRHSKRAPGRTQQPAAGDPQEAPQPSRGRKPPRRGRS